MTKRDLTDLRASMSYLSDAINWISGSDDATLRGHTLELRAMLSEMTKTVHQNDLKNHG